MRLKKTEGAKTNTKRSNKSHLATKGLLNSRYKRVVKYNLKKACNKSIFGVRRRSKFPKLCKTSHTTSMALKIAVFACVALVACV
ncbi:hypothetical protein KO504_16215 [Winogradskyella psychrotolerans]|uniref:hypothetical protein n=1 Tax=Winogradskyella psychrotolerans TaxID=1344585 RepID=UPI001C074BC2|nr:hypothetical protein [Winogradskyella psychrotolerans]MBU2922895.1 hypothetical protein [Winogradskyella psychrotolerans]